jgi:DNA end-binding protein Ku
MARAIWTGSLSFGLVNVPVGLFAATEDKTIRFNQFHAESGDRIRQKRVNEKTGEDVEFSEVVKGYDLGDGKVALISPEELEAIEPGRTREISITDFVDLDDIDPIFYKSSYYLAPQGEIGRRAYALLRTAMEESRKVGIATFVLRGKQHLVAVRPETEVIGLETMFFADEVRDPAKEIYGIPVEAEFQPRELDTAKLLIDSMSTKWNPAAYHDTYRKRVEELIDQKRHGQVITLEKREAALPPVVDLMEALRASVEAAGGRRTAAGAGGGTGAGAGATDRSTAKGSSGRKPEAAAAAKTKRASGSKVKVDLTKLSKSELYDRATELSIPGRSKMSREELEDALSGSEGRRQAS